MHGRLRRNPHGAKHNALYAAVLPQIARRRRFKIIAIVRHPVDVVASWASLDLPISRGLLPAADRYWPEMARLTAGDGPLIRKQLLIFELLCRRFLDLEGRAVIIRYEDMVIAPHLISAVIKDPPQKSLSLSSIAITPHARTQAIEEQLRTMIKDGLLPTTERLYPNSYRRDG